MWSNAKKTVFMYVYVRIGIKCRIVKSLVLRCTFSHGLKHTNCETDAALNNLFVT